MNSDSDNKEPSTARKMAWSVASDINVIAIYRLVMMGATTLLMAIVGYLGAGVLSGQADLSQKMAVGNANITNTIALIDAANHRVDLLLLRVNDLDHRTTILETKMDNPVKGR